MNGCRWTVGLVAAVRAGPRWCFAVYIHTDVDHIRTGVNPQRIPASRPGTPDRDRRTSERQVVGQHIRKPAC